MGYYVETMEVDFFIPEDKIEQAFDAVIRARHEITVEDRYNPWLWTLGDYPVSDLRELLNELGFGIEEEFGGIRVVNFDAKWRTQDWFLDKLKDYVDKTSFIEFRGEDGEMWKWTPLGVLTAEIIWR